MTGRVGIGPVVGWSNSAGRRDRLNAPVMTHNLLLSVPSDVPPRVITAVEHAVNAWNRAHGTTRGHMFLARHWTRDAVPEAADDPQNILDRQLVDPSECLLAIFYRRLGTPTPRSVSGVVEEIDRMVGNGRGSHVAVYFLHTSPPMGDDGGQWAALQSFKHERHTVLFWQTIRQQEVAERVHQFLEHQVQLFETDLQSEAGRPALHADAEPLTSGPGEQVESPGDSSFRQIVGSLHMRSADDVAWLSVVVQYPSAFAMDDHWKQAVVNVAARLFDRPPDRLQRRVLPDYVRCWSGDDPKQTLSLHGSGVLDWGRALPGDPLPLADVVAALGLGLRWLARDPLMLPETAAVVRTVVALSNLPQKGVSPQGLFTLEPLGTSFPWGHTVRREYDLAPANWLDCVLRFCDDLLAEEGYVGHHDMLYQQKIALARALAEQPW